MADYEEMHDARGDDVKDVSMLQTNIGTREQNNAVTQQLEIVAKTISDLSQTVKKGFHSPTTASFHAYTKKHRI